MTTELSPSALPIGEYDLLWPEDGQLSATAEVAFGATADLSGEGGLVATAEVAFGATADLRGRGHLAATAEVAFGATASLRAFNPIAGETDHQVVIPGGGLRATIPRRG